MLPAHISNPNPDVYLSENYAVIDFETTAIDHGDPINKNNQLLLAVVYLNKSDKLNVYWGSEYEQGELLSDLRSCDFFVAHNTKFELGWLNRCGGVLTEFVPYCTQIGEYVLAGNIFVPKDLDSVATRYGAPLKNKQVKRLMDMGVDPRNMPKQMLEQYCIGDVLSEWDIFKKQRHKLQRRKLLPHQYTRCIFTPVLADIEANGMYLDANRVDQLHKITEKKYLELTKELHEFTGGINQNSPKQVAEFIYDRLGFSELKDHRGNPIRTAAGGRSTDKNDLEKLTPRNQKQRKFIDLYLRQGKSETNHVNYLAKFKACSDAGGVLYANFNQTVTKTHRLSSSGKEFKIQFQNMDREFKPLFTARNKGWKLFEIDEAQLEFRAAVWLGNDRQGRLDIANKEDVHSFTASILHNISYDEMVKNKKVEPYATWRQDAKEDTFKPLYGGQSGTPEQMRYYEAFRKKYVDITKTQKGWAEYALVHKKVVLPHGFVFYFPTTRMTAQGYITNTTNIYNYPVQHFATAEIVPVGVTYLWHRMKEAELQSFLVNTVHDSAIGEVHPDEGELLSKIAVQAFTEDVVVYLKKVYSVDFDVPLEAEVSFGTHWGEKKDWKEKWGII